MAFSKRARRLWRLLYALYVTEDGAVVLSGDYWGVDRKRIGPISLIRKQFATRHHGSNLTSVLVIIPISATTS